MRLRRDTDAQPPGLDWEARGPWQTHNELTTRQTVEHDGSTYFCRVRDSSDGSWRIAYGSPIEGDGSRAFLRSNGDLQWTSRVDHPIGGLVSDRGTVVILGGGTSNGLDGSVRAFDSDGAGKLRDTYPANVADGDLSADGSLAVVQTYPPDNRTFLYDLHAEQLVVDHSSDWVQPTVARCGSDGDTQYTYLSPSHDKRPLYALDERGSMVWESDRHRRKRPLVDRLRKRFVTS